MAPLLSRRDFLKFSGLSLGSVALTASLPASLVNWAGPQPSPTPVQIPAGVPGVGRVTTAFIYCYKDPDFKSERVLSFKRDHLLPILEEITSTAGPKYNPRWYRLEAGYVHSGHVQRVEKSHLNTPLSAIREGGQLGEITQPFTRVHRKTRFGWVPLYRLYYSSVHWITGLDVGPDGTPWYLLTDELLHVQYGLPATHVRPIDAQELSPISPDVPVGQKRIYISLRDQKLAAYEDKRVVFETSVSTGIPNEFRSEDEDEEEIPTATPAGSFHIQVKMPSKHMGDGRLTDEIGAYELVGVPWVCFFHVTGVAIHGTYWHDNFGRVMSHGCVNLCNPDALWIYRWSTPVALATEWNRKGYGTLVKIY